MAAPEQIAAIDNAGVSDEDSAATLVLDSAGVRGRGLSPSVASCDIGDGSLHAAALIGLRFHMLYTPVDGSTYDTVAHAVVTE